jgi:hypothetical protein
LVRFLEGFIYGKTARGPFKKMVTPAFQGTLEFEDLRTKTLWSFSLKEGDWEVKKNGSVLEAISHKSSDVQGFCSKRSASHGRSGRTLSRLMATP